MRDTVIQLTTLIVAIALVMFVPEQTSASGSLKITEVMSASSHAPTGDHNYWWELTNAGLSSVNLNGYSWDDNNAVAGSFVFPNVIIDAGESIIILERLDPNTAVTDFETAWDLTPGELKILTALSFVPQSLPGFGLAGEVHLFDPSDVLVDSALSVPTPVVGISNEYILSTDSWRQSIAGENGAYLAPNGTDIGSPGLIPEPASLWLLAFGTLAFLRRRRAA